MTKYKSNVVPKFIYLEGVDRSGKDSLWNEIDKQTKYRHIVTDRGPVGFLAYCEIFKKSRSLVVAYRDMEKQLELLPNVLVIYLDCSTEELVRRCNETNHEILDFDRHKKIYETLFNASKLPKVKVDTTNKSAEEIVKELVEGGLI